MGERERERNINLPSTDHMLLTTATTCGSGQIQEPGTHFDLHVGDRGPRYSGRLSLPSHVHQQEGRSEAKQKADVAGSSLMWHIIIPSPHFYNYALCIQSSPVDWPQLSLGISAVIKSTGQAMEDCSDSL